VCVRERGGRERKKRGLDINFYVLIYLKRIITKHSTKFFIFLWFHCGYLIYFFAVAVSLGCQPSDEQTNKAIMEHLQGNNTSTGTVTSVPISSKHAGA
jgi:hypothetical protein